MNYFKRKKQIKELNELIDKLESMTPEARQKLIECLTLELQIIEEKINIICDEQYDILQQQTTAELTDQQVLILHFACILACYSVGGILGKLTGNNEFFGGLVYSIVLSMPATVIAKMGLEKNYLQNRLLLAKYKKLDKEVIALCKAREELATEIYNISAYNYMIEITERFSKANRPRSNDEITK